MIRFCGISLLIVALTGCGQTGPLYLTKEYKTQHATVEQPEAPSESLQPLQSNQRIVANS